MPTPKWPRTSLRRRFPESAVALAVLGLIAGCGGLQGPRTGNVSPPADALSAWNDFPADAKTRPIVLFGIYFPKAGFSSGEAKIAAYCNKFALGFQPPSEIPKEAISIWADGTSATYAAISASDAYAAMTRGPAGTSYDCTSAAPLAVTAARLGPSEFQTDRGLAQMSAWLFTVSGALGEFAYPAIAPSAFWRNGQTQESIGGGATISPNGHVLNFTFIGGPTEGACAVDYSGVVAESSHAVAVAVESSPGRTVAGPQACDLVGHIRAVTVTLQSVLGGRVVIDASGAPVAVCPERSRGC
jgi:hypothetical protein